MKYEDIYRRWVQERSRIEVDPDFAGRVMNRIRFEPSWVSQLARRWARLVERISVSSRAQAAALGLAGLVGLIRILLTLHLLLSV
ncbi:MAG: hypothetical protein JSW27_18855 [Phycisphaerales bacterium]|nr:MAG: hypothetical protein JSW27_18855 [Phycisphaerales bacterium]